MNRKLHNSLMGIVASCCMLLLGLVAAVPATPALDPGVGALAGIDAAQDGLGQDVIEEATRADAGKPVTRVRRGRSALAMPFFSFAPRG